MTYVLTCGDVRINYHKWYQSGCDTRATQTWGLALNNRDGGDFNKYYMSSMKTENEIKYDTK